MKPQSTPSCHQEHFLFGIAEKQKIAVVTGSKIDVACQGYIHVAKHVSALKSS
jgi:hypothetical protein